MDESAFEIVWWVVRFNWSLNMSSSPQHSVLQLPEHLDRSGVQDLKRELDAHLGQNITLDGTANKSINGLGLQLIKFAQQHWQTSGWTFEISNASDTLNDALGWFTTASDTQIGETEECL